MPTPKPGYFIASYNVSDETKFKEYQKKALPALEGKCEVITLGLNPIITEGEKLQMTVVLKFPSTEKLLEWYNSPEYQEILPERLESTSNLRAYLGE